MRSFFQFLFASCLGTILAIVVLGIIGSLSLGRLATMSESTPTVPKNAVLWLPFDQQIPERTNNLSMNPIDLSQQKILGVPDICRAIETAGEDDQIQSILLDLESVNLGQASLDLIRSSLLTFRESGKPIYAYGDYYSQKTYHLASIADNIYLNPMGSIDFRGYSAVIPFFKEMLDKVGVDMQVFSAGKFKSATEPYWRTDMSEENRLQLRQFIDTLYQHYLADISTVREIPVNDLHQMADEYLIRQAQDAKGRGLVDQIGYKQEVLVAIKEAIGLEEDDKLPTVTIEDYFQSGAVKADYTIKDKIAVVYAEGNILSGESEPGEIGDKTYIKMLREVRKDKRVKALVLRVNSPGGSALASDNIWHEIKVIQDEGIPVVVSMGDYAASGGYYIACASDSIFAQPNTLTGSIGVFFVIPDASELTNERLGITVDTIKTGQFATGISPFYPVSEKERAILEQSTDFIYQTFLTRVKDARGYPDLAAVNEVARGRVWTGVKAQEIGLVDEIGGLDDAVDAAAYLAGSEKYRLVEYPKIKDPLMLLLEELQGTTKTVNARLLRAELGEYYPYYEQVKSMIDQKGVQARLPYLIEY
ncbi:MAG: signal peptide peptidase SppA [Bacteroidota bacterium]